MPSTRSSPRLVDRWIAGRKALVTLPPHNPDRSNLLSAGIGPWAPSIRETPVAQVGDGSGTSILETLLRVKAEMLSEITLTLWRRPDVRSDPPVPYDAPTLHPLQLLLDAPNPQMGWEDIIDYEVGAIDVAGTGFLLKQRDPSGQVIALWPLYPEYVTPRGNPVVTAWRYQTPGQTPVDLPPEDVVVRRMGISRSDHRIGRSAVAAVLREIATDEEAARYASTILHNLGVPGVVISPKAEVGNVPPTPEQRDEVRRTWKDRFGGARRGDPFVTAGAWDVNVVSFNPKDLELTKLRHVTEERISGAIGIPAILAGLGTGLEHATYSNVDGLREFTTEQKLVPWWRVAGRQWTRQLVDDPTLLLAYPVDEVRALAVDVDANAVRVSGLYVAGIVGLAEARGELGYAPDEIPDDLHPAAGETGSRVPGDGDGDGIAGDAERQERSHPLHPLLQSKAASDGGVDLDAWATEYEGDVAAVLTGWATRFTSTAGLATDPDQLGPIADEAIGDASDLQRVLVGLGIALVADVANSDDALPTRKAATLNPRDVELGMDRFVRDHTARAVTGISEWTRVRVRNVIARGVAAGDPMDKIIEGVERWIKDPARAKRIAETEAHAIRWAASDYAARVDPRPMWKTWVAQGDDRTRDSHAAANGQRVLDFEYFNVGGAALAYPGDPGGPAEEVVNCRCELVYNLATRTPGGYFGR